MGPQSELEQQELPAAENEKSVDRVAALELQEDELEPPELDLQNLINPNDNISTVSKSKSSSVTSAHSKALAEQTALLTRREELHAKHALEQQRMILDSKIEDAELEADIAASDAKIKVLENFDMQSRLSASQSEDGMKSYLVSHRPKFPPSRQRQSPVDFAQIATLPKTLQTIMQHSRPATVVTTTKQPGAIPKFQVLTPKSVRIAKLPINLNPKQEKISLKVSSQRPIPTELSPDYFGLLLICLYCSKYCSFQGFGEIA